MTGFDDNGEQRVSSKRPYLIRAMHEWMTDNHHTPYLVVDAGQPDVNVPSAYVDDGRIVLNVSYSAVDGLVMGNADIEFNARFGGTPFSISVPVSSVLAIYARETGQGVVFSEGEGDGGGDSPPPAGTDSSQDAPATSSRPTLKVIK
ncbi:MAG: ClpXP protease specificity-enhancing factor [Pseudomonadota bacterium]